MGAARCSETASSSAGDWLTLGCWYPSDGGRFTFANHAGAALLGASGPQELLGQPIIERVAPGSRGIVKQRMGAIGAGASFAPLIEETFLRLDGTPVAVEVSARPCRVAHEMGVQVVGAATVRERDAVPDVRSYVTVLMTVRSRAAHHGARSSIAATPWSASGSSGSRRGRVVSLAPASFRHAQFWPMTQSKQQRPCSDGARSRGAPGRFSRKGARLTRAGGRHGDCSLGTWRSE